MLHQQEVFRLWLDGAGDSLAVLRSENQSVENQELEGSMVQRNSREASYLSIVGVQVSSQPEQRKFPFEGQELTVSARRYVGQDGSLRRLPAAAQVDNS